jgi:hypothetical protein
MTLAGSSEEKVGSSFEQPETDTMVMKEITHTAINGFGIFTFASYIPLVTRENQIMPRAFARSPAFARSRAFARSPAIAGTYAIAHKLLHVSCARG